MLNMCVSSARPPDPSCSFSVMVAVRRRQCYAGISNSLTPNEFSRKPKILVSKKNEGLDVR